MSSCRDPRRHVSKLLRLPAVAIGIGSHTVVAKQLGSIQGSLYVAPSYLASAGMLQHLDELHKHHLIGNSAIPTGSRWPVKLTSKLLSKQSQTITDYSALVLALALVEVWVSRS